MQKILVVDDEEDMRSLQKEMLEKQDYEVFEASSGKEAIELVREEKPDLVLLDVVMPEMRGWEVCRIIREDPEISKTKIIMVTSKSTYEDKVYSFGTSKADWHISKPFEMEKYLETIEWAMESNNTKLKLTSNLWHFSNKILKKTKKQDVPDVANKEIESKSKKRLRLFKVKNIFKRNSKIHKAIESNMAVETPKSTKRFRFLSIRGIVRKWIDFDLRMTKKYMDWDKGLTDKWVEKDQEFTHRTINFFKRLTPGKNPLAMGKGDIKEVEKLGLENPEGQMHTPEYEIGDSTSQSVDLLKLDVNCSPPTSAEGIKEQFDIPDISSDIMEKPKPRVSIDQNYIRNLVFATLKPKGKQPYYLNGEPINNLLELKKNLTYIKDSDAYWVALWIEYLGDEITSKRILDSPAKFREIVSDRCDYILEHGREIMDDMPEKFGNNHDSIMYS